VVLIAAFASFRIIFFAAFNDGNIYLLGWFRRGGADQPSICLQKSVFDRPGEGEVHLSQESEKNQESTQGQPRQLYSFF
jgi:hypothetical protein